MANRRAWDITKDPRFAAALERGRKLQEEILAGPEMLTAAQVARMMNISIEEVSSLMRRFELLGLSAGDREPHYPSWQFIDGRPFASLPEISLHFWEDHWVVYRFLLQPLERLLGSRPLDLLIDGRVDIVLELAIAIEQCGIL